MEEENLFECAKIYLNIIEKYITTEKFTKKELNDELSSISKVCDEKIKYSRLLSMGDNSDYFFKRDVEYHLKKSHYKLLKLITENKKIFFLESLMKLSEIVCCAFLTHSHFYFYSLSESKGERMLFLIKNYSKEIEILKRIYSYL